jgi:hypothetical protein
VEPKILEGMNFPHASTKDTETATAIEEEEDDAFVEMEITHMCKDSYDGDAVRVFSPAVCTKFRRFFLTHPEESMVCCRKNIQIVPDNFADEPE